MNPLIRFMRHSLTNILTATDDADQVDIEKTTKAHKEAVAKINQEMREYNENLAKQNRETKFKPIQATSKSKTYEDKDIRREFFENFLKAEQEKGTDITEILNQLAKLGKFDVKA